MAGLTNFSLWAAEAARRLRLFVGVAHKFRSVFRYGREIMSIGKYRICGLTTVLRLPWDMYG